MPIFGERTMLPPYRLECGMLALPNSNTPGRVKDFEGFKCAYHKLVELGFDKRYIAKSLALCLAKK